MPKVCIAILNYNGQHYLQQFLPQLLDTQYEDFEVLIGDNASTDSSIDFLESHYKHKPNIRWVVFSENYGFAGGYNALFKHISSPYTVLLNSDILVDKDWLSPLILTLENNLEIAACQPFIHSFKKPEYFEHAGAAGGYIDKYGFVFCMGRVFFNTEKVNEASYSFKDDLFWVSGAALAIKTDIFNTHGGFDVDFFAHMEEIDLCWRIKLHGYKLANCPNSKVFHVGGGTLEYESPFKVFLNFRNNILMLQKNVPSASTLFFVLFIRQIFDFAALLRFLFEGKPTHAKMIIKAYWEICINYRKTQQKRIKVQTGIKKNSVSGVYNKSIVLEYFLKGKRTFKQLDVNSFSK